MIELELYERKNYYGISKPEVQRGKIGYIGKNGWLNVSQELKDKIGITGPKWEFGNTHGGSKEKWKFRYDSVSACLDALENFGIDIINKDITE